MVKRNIGITDSHQHFVDIDRFDYYWMSPEMPRLRRNFLPNDLEALLEPNGIVQTVAVQAHPSLEETRYLVRLADAHPFIGAIIAWVDLTDPRIDQILEELSSYASVKAVRHQTAEDEPEDWFLRENVLRGLEAVAQSGLAYDMLIRPRHLSSVPRVLDRVPRLHLVVEHMAKPPITSKELEPWSKHLSAVAEIPSIFCKVSALVTEADHSSWTVEDLKPYVQHALRVFGIERLMWGSDWPVCLLAASYEQVIESSLEAIGPLDSRERALFLSENARAFYGF